jgi:hypothetical protein
MSFRLLLLLCLLNVNSGMAQNCLDDILSSDLYSNSGEIINGRKWIYEKKYSGSPLLMIDYWPKADISYNGKLYTGQFMNYDLFKNELIIYQSEKLKEKFVLINTDKLSGFSFKDTVTGKSHSFEYKELPGIQGRSLYEHIPAGRIVFYIKPVKKAEIRSVGAGEGKWLNYYEYYVGSGNLFTRFRSRHQLIDLLPEHGSELKRYMRKNMIRLSDQHPEGMFAAISYLKSLE